MSQDYTNDVTGALTTLYTSGGTSLVFTLSTGSLPTTGRIFYLQVAAETVNTAEYFKCTSYTSALGVYTATVVGAQSGSGASNHAITAVVTGCWWLPVVVDGVRSDQSQAGTYANLPTSGMKQGDCYKQTDGPYEWFYNGSAWIPIIGGFGQVAAPPLASWTWDNQGGGTLDTTNGYPYAVFPNAGATSTRMLYRSAPSTPYTITVLLSHDFGGLVGPTGSECGWQVGFGDSSGKYVVILGQLSSSAWKVGTQKWSSSSSYNSQYVGASITPTVEFMLKNPIWLQIKDDGTNLTFNTSLDGQHWNQFDQRSRTDFLTSPSRVTFGAYVGNCQMTLAILGWG